MRKKPADIDAYIAAFDPDVRAILQRIRETVQRTAPAARETISYGIPAFKLKRVLVYFAAFKAHIGFYPPVRGDAKIEAAAARYAGEKGNLRFPLHEPMPYKLIERLTKLRVRQESERNAAG
ncbi:MAG TPA: DUF1801 domain-containing protein [Rhodanobacteraceae bacterium]